MMTFTVTPAQLNRLRPGDIITHFDDVEIGPVTVTSHLARLDDNGPTCLPGTYPSSSTIVHIYPDTCLAEQIRVIRPGVSTPAARRSVKTKRTIDGVTFLRVGDRQWRTEDGQYEVVYGFGGYTECEENHPVRITAGVAAAARDAQGTSWARPILDAIAAGRAGYTCNAGSEHPYNVWHVWNLGGNDYADGLTAFVSFNDAAKSLASYLAR